MIFELVSSGPGGFPGPEKACRSCEPEVTVGLCSREGRGRAARFLFLALLKGTEEKGPGEGGVCADFFLLEVEQLGPPFI